MAQTRVAIVTGANKGIGLAIMRRMCKEFNGDVILTARDKSRGQTAVTQLEGEGLHPKFHQLDIDSRDSISGLKEFVEKNYGGELAYKGCVTPICCTTICCFWSKYYDLSCTCYCRCYKSDTPKSLVVEVKEATRGVPYIYKFL